MSITRINKFEAKDGMQNELAAFLKSIVPTIERSQGCKACHVLQSQGNSNEFVVLEVWESIAAHQASAKDIPAEQISSVMSMLAGPPSGSYYAAPA